MTATVNAQKDIPPQPPNKPRNRGLLWFSLLILLIAILWLCYWFFYLRFHESTDDAYANGNFINVNSPISGSVVAFYADDTDLVQQGQLLVALDPTAYQIAFEKELATLASTALQVKQLYEKVEVNKAQLKSKHIALKKALYDYNNRSHLVDSQAIAKEDFIHSQDDLFLAEANLEEAQHQLEVSLAAAGNTPMDKHPLLEEQTSRVRQAYYNVKHCNLYAPATGYIAQRTVDVG